MSSDKHEEPATGHSEQANLAAPSDFTPKQVARGGAWTVIGFGLGTLMRVGSSIVLTRVIPDAPSVYGVMAIVFSVYGGILLFTDVGVALLLTQNKRGAEPSFRNTAWTAQVLRGVAIWLLAVALSPLFASAYPDFPGVQELVIVTALAAVIGGFTSTSAHLFSRNMEIHRLAKLDLIAQLGGTSITIAHALIAPSPWSLVSGTLATAATRLVTSHLMSDMRQRFQWDRDAASQMVIMGRWVFLSTALAFACHQADRLLFAKIITVEQLGVYSIAVRLSHAAADVLRRLSGNVVYPILCRTHHAGGDLSAAFFEHRSRVVAAASLALTFLCGGGAAVLDLLYEDEFAAGGWILQIFAVYAWVDCCLLTPRLQVVLAMGQPRWSAAANFTKVLAMIALIWVGYQQYGFGGAVVGYALAELPRYAVTLWGCCNVGVLRPGSDLILVLWFAAVSAATLLIDMTLAAQEYNSLVRCIAATILPTIVWGRSALQVFMSRKTGRAAS